MSKPGPKPKIPDNAAPELLRRYRAGESPAALAAELAVHRGTLLSFLQRHGLKEEELQAGGDPPVSPEIAAQIVYRYCELKEGPKKLREDYGVCKRTVHNLVHRAGFDIRAEKGVRFAARHDAFDVLTPEAAYWAGMLMADGCISESPYKDYDYQPHVILVLGRKDAGHVAAFRAFLGAEQYKIQDCFDRERAKQGKDVRASRLSVASRPLCTRLKSLGITPRKTFTAKASAELATNRDFWRGVSDGDGCVHATCVHDLLGSKALCEQYVDYMESLFPGLSYSFYQRPGCWCVAVHGPDARRWLGHLYRTGDVVLDRMLKRALHWASGATAKLPLYKAGYG